MSPLSTLKQQYQSDIEELKEKQRESFLEKLKDQRLKQPANPSELDATQYFECKYYPLPLPSLASKRLLPPKNRVHENLDGPESHDRFLESAEFEKSFEQSLFRDPPKPDQSFRFLRADGQPFMKQLRFSEHQAIVGKYLQQAGGSKQIRNAGQRTQP